MQEFALQEFANFANPAMAAKNFQPYIPNFRVHNLLVTVKCNRIDNHYIDFYVAL